jgi:hypothetical protein
LSFTTIFAAPAAFIFYCALFQPIIVIALISLIGLYHLAPQYTRITHIHTINQRGRQHNDDYNENRSAYRKN